MYSVLHELHVHQHPLRLVPDLVDYWGPGGGHTQRGRGGEQVIHPPHSALLEAAQRLPVNVSAHLCKAGLLLQVFHGGVQVVRMDAQLPPTPLQHLHLQVAQAGGQLGGGGLGRGVELGVGAQYL